MSNAIAPGNRDDVDKERRGLTGGEGEQGREDGAGGWMGVGDGKELGMLLLAKD